MLENIDGNEGSFFNTRLFCGKKYSFKQLTAPQDLTDFQSMMSNTFSSPKIMAFMIKRNGSLIDFPVQR